MKRILGQMLCVAVIGVFLFANALPVGAQDQIELRMTWWGSQGRHDQTIKVIELFQAKNPNIKIVYEFSGWRDYFTKLTTQAAGGNLPDIMQHDYSRLAEWVGNGLLLPLDEYISSNVINTADVPAIMLEGGKVDGKMYGINLGANAPAVIVDLDAFKKAGIELPAADWTWDDFEQICMTLHEKLGIWGMGGTLADHQTWKTLYLSLGQWAYSADGKSLGYTDDQPLINKMKMLRRLIEAEAYPPRDVELAEFFNSGPEGNPVVTGKAAMAMFWSNQIAAMQKAAGPDRHLGLIGLPKEKGGCCSPNYIKPSMFFSITKDAKHPKEAAMFIDFFVNSPEANEIMKGERGVPISTKIRAALKESLDPVQAMVFDFVEKVEQDNTVLPPADPVAHADVYNNVFLPEFADPVLLGEITPEEGVAVLREMATEILSQK